jgi:hypothetical protein
VFRHRVGFAGELQDFALIIHEPSLSDVVLHMVERPLVKGSDAMASVGNYQPRLRDEKVWFAESVFFFSFVKVQPNCAFELRCLSSFVRRRSEG